MRFFATCAKGTEGALRRELSALRLHAVRGDRGGVSFEGTLEAGMRACLHVRTAMRVLLEKIRRNESGRTVASSTVIDELAKKRRAAATVG